MEGNFLFGAICNSTSIGGILTLPTEQVDMGDGIFEVMLIREARSLTELTECITAVQNQKYNCAMITFRSAKNIKITCDPYMAWSLDGEKADGYAQFQVDNLHHAMHLIQRVEETA